MGDMINGGDAPAGDAGQVIPTAPDPGQAAEPFFSFTGADGKVSDFATKEDLSKGFGQSFLRQSDYTRKTQEHSEAVKKWEADKAKNDEDYKTKQEEFSKFDNLVRTRPDVLKMFREMMSKQPNSDVQSEVLQKMVDAQLGPMKKEWETEKETRETERVNREQQAAYDKMKTQHADFDEKAVSEALQTFNAKDPQKVVELFYYYNKGKMDPAAKAEADAIERTKKQGGALPPSSSGRGTPGKVTGATSIEEARRAAQADI